MPTFETRTASMADHLETYHPNTLFIFHGTAYASRETRHAIQEAKYQHQVSNDRWTRRVSVLDRANMSEEEEEIILLPIRPPQANARLRGKKDQVRLPGLGTHCPRQLRLWQRFRYQPVETTWGGASTKYDLQNRQVYIYSKRDAWNITQFRILGANLPARHLFKSPLQKPWITG